jgi:DEAD/DEAH box helicase domain-containing protein
MNSNSIPNYVALIKASEEHLHPPDWLAIGKAIYSPKHGLGEVVGIIGNQLVANFSKENQPISLNWVSAIASQELMPCSESAQPLLGAGFEEIGLGLAETIAYTETIPPIDGELFPLPDDLPIALSNSLKAVGIEQIYSHQLESLQAVRQGKDICILTENNGIQAPSFQDGFLLPIFPFHVIIIVDIH